MGTAYRNRDQHAASERAEGQECDAPKGRKHGALGCRRHGGRRLHGERSQV